MNGEARRDSTAAILAAAEREFSRGGFAAARMARIAAEAGLPKTNLHYYFGTKERLYRAVLERILTQWLDAAAEWIVPERDPAEALSGYVRAKLLDARTRPGASRIFAGEVLRGAPLLMPFLCGEMRRRVEAMGAVIEGWAARGLMDRMPPAHVFFCIWAMTQTYADFDVQIRAVLGEDARETDIRAAAIATVTAFVLKGCGVRTA
ncbi:MAG: TetR family transcriptional regulator C-terminal domain-containing protein [Alphaproteobacteria bacterium]|nr:TetR family transcriptional regulator C-terminal domain-containing protein [Alphaproteobacteria bacterium]